MPLRKNKYICVGNFNKDYKYFIYNSVVPWNKIYRRAFLTENKIEFQDFVCSNDRAFYFHTVKRADRIVVVSEYLVHYRVNNKNSLVGRARSENFRCLFRSAEKIQ